MVSTRRSSQISQSLFLVVMTLVLGYAILQPSQRMLTDWNFCLVGLGLVAVMSGWLAHRDTQAPRLERWLAWAVLLVPCYVAWQLLPLPAFLLRVLSPERAWGLDNLKPLMQPPAFATITISPVATPEFLFRMIGYTLTFLAIRNIAWRLWEKRRWAAVIPLIAVAALEAGFGLWQYAAGTPVQGSYLNRNHFACLLEMALPVSIAYALALYNGERFRPPSPGFNALKACAVLAVAAALLQTLFYSQSKTGVLAGLGGLFVMGALAMVSTLRGWKRAAAMACFAALVLLLFVFLMPDSMVGNFGQTVSDESNLDLEGRWPIWANTLRLIRAYPLFGCGLGTYETAFLKYQSAYVHVSFLFAHNDYLQLASELGAVGFLILAAVIGGIFLKALRAATGGPDRHTRYLGMGCAGAMTAIFIHSFTDFNMYLTSNAMFLAWVAGIAGSLPAGGRERVPQYGFPGPTFFRRFAVALGLLVLLYAPAWLVYRTFYWSDPHAEQIFCRFGICDTAASLAAQIPRKGEGISSAPVSALMEAIRRSPASPDRWRHLGDALLMSGNVEQARYCFSTALALAPNIPNIMLAAAGFYYTLGEKQQALDLASRALEKSALLDDVVFDWCKNHQIAASQLLNALPEGPRASQACLRYWMAGRNQADASLAWNWVLSHRYADDKLAHQYVAFLINAKDYEAAARSWAGYLGDHRNGYLESNWVFNGDFEAQPSGEGFDWTIDVLPGVAVAWDSSVANTGSHSLRIHFEGKENLEYHHVFQKAFVTPGTYRFEAFLRTREITTSQGVGFRIFDAENESHLSVKTEQLTGTNGWKKIEQTIQVPRGTRLVAIHVARPRVVLKFDDKIAGTAWIDSVRLSRRD